MEVFGGGTRLCDRDHAGADSLRIRFGQERILRDLRGLYAGAARQGKNKLRNEAFAPSGQCRGHIGHLQRREGLIALSDGGGQNARFPPAVVVERWVERDYIRLGHAQGPQVLFGFGKRRRLKNV